MTSNTLCRVMSLIPWVLSTLMTLGMVCISVTMIVSTSLSSYTIAGTKNVDKQVKKITEGRVRDRGVTWFPQLVDKSEWDYGNNSKYYFHHIITREKYQGASVLGDEELWRLSGATSPPRG